MNGPSLGRPRFITVDEALGWHELAIARYGGSSGLRDAGLLESALAQPRQGFGGQYTHEFPFGMAAAYAFHLARNHAFVDGNKRIALWCCGSFLRINGWDLLSEGEDAADRILELIAGTLDKPGYAEWLKQHARARVVFDLRDFFATLRMDQIITQASSIAPSRLAEISATINETRAAMPLLADLEPLLKPPPQLTPDDTRAVTAWNFTILLVAIHRLAEEQGYEW